MSAPFSPDLLLSSIPGSFHLPLAALAGVVFDRLFGEVRRWHPLVGFGKFADAVESALNRGPVAVRRGSGLLAWALAVLPWVALAAWAGRDGFVGWLLDAVLLYVALGGGLVERR